MQNAECRIRRPVSRITDYVHPPQSTLRSAATEDGYCYGGRASRVTPLAPRASRAFTLIELLVVIAVIALLAALTFPAVQGVKASAIRTRAKGELTQFETAIERFNQKLGYYPPDNPDTLNPNHWALPPLYYELLGTTNSIGVFHTLDDSAPTINAAALAAGTGPFGPKVTGFVNCSRPGKGDDVPGAIAFVNNLKPSQFLAITNGNGSANPVFSVLGTTIEGPLMYQNASGAKLNPWRYNSSNPQHNPKSFDLWIDVAVGSKTNRISNWSDRPLVVGSP